MIDMNTVELSAHWQLAGDSVHGEWWLPGDSTSGEGVARAYLTLTLTFAP